MATSPTAASTPQAAGVKTAASGVYSDPAQVGAMIKQMYPQYANFDATTLGQRWIDMHTAAAAGSGSGTDAVLSGPVGTTPLTSTDPNQNAPDLSGLDQFASPVQPTIQQSINNLPKTPLLGNSQYNPASATMSAPKPKPAPSVPNFKPLPKNSPINKLNLTI